VLRPQGVGTDGTAQIATLGTPEALLAWHRNLIAQKYNGTAHRAPWRPRIAAEIEVLVVRMAEENPEWRIGESKGALPNLAHELARSANRADPGTTRHRASTGADPREHR
jgi:hypothetical protein